MKNSTNEVRRFFAAANGFNGFRSNFDELFSHEGIDKLFILKGGPGTGKSTLMRKLSGKYKNKCEVTEILCSSDVNSLDGVIIEREGKRVAVADGTAPHVIEPQFPGAFERIVNLGDGFDYDGLMARSERIISLASSKKEAYRKAYDALRIAGDIQKYIMRYCFETGIKKKAEFLAQQLLTEISNSCFGSANNKFLLSSFSKDGFTKLPYSVENKKEITIKGDGLCEYLLTSSLRQKADEAGLAKSIYTSPLSESMIDLLETENIIFKVASENAHDADIVFSLGNNIEYESLKLRYDAFIKEAQEAFKEASIYHFELEDIYSGKTSFEHNGVVEETISKDISAFLEK